MKSILRGLCCMGLLVGFSTFASAAVQTMTGQISDSMCGASHAKMIDAHPGAKMTPASCTLACVKAGAKFVFVSGGKVYNLANQDFAALPKDAGRTVRITGEFNGDTVTISKMALRAAAKKT